MPKSGAERNKAYRERIKANPEKCKLIKEKDKERKKKERRTKKLTTAEAFRKRAQGRERVRLHRQRKKNSLSKQPVAPGEVYKTPQALGKAIGKVKRALPSSPRKRNAVLARLASETGAHPELNQRQKQPHNKLSPDTVKCIEDFYVCDSISRQAPGIRDYVTVKVKGKKAKLQKRHLLWSLKETFALFCKEHPNVKVGLSSFCSLRPANVLLSSAIPRNVCLCQYHDNIKLLCEAIHKAVPTFPLYSGDFVNNFVCNSENELCMTGKCSNCPDWIEDFKRVAPLDEPVEWNQWERVKVSVSAKDGREKKTTTKVQKVLKEGTVEDLLFSLHEMMPAFLDHVFVKRKQSKFFEEKRSNLEPNEAIVQVDFSENYTCSYQDEIQSAHWHKEQVTLFPVVIWSKNSSHECSCESHVIVSDDRTHDKLSVSVFMDKVITDFVKRAHPSVESVHIFSDGPSSQFKNRYVVNFLCGLQQRSGLNVKWHFFATAHGKGAVDGIGGTVKRSVWNAVACRKVPVVDSADSFARVASEVCNISTKIHLIKQEEIKSASKKFELQNASPIPGISKLHCIEPINGTVLVRKYSSQPECVNKIVVYIEADMSDSSDDDSVEREDSEDEFGREDNEESEHSDSVDVEGDDDDDDDSDVDDDDDDNDDGDVDNDNDSNDDDVEGEYDSGSEKEDNFEEDDRQCEQENVYVKVGLPSELKAILNECSSFQVPFWQKPLIDCLAAGSIAFGGSSLITESDINGLIGNRGTSEDKWVTNFIVDSYLQLLKKESQQLKVEVLTWERFEKGVGAMPIQQLLQGRMIHDQDIVLVPCNIGNSKHWFLLVVEPKEKRIVAYDSMPTSFLKPRVQMAISKMIFLMKQVDSDLDVAQWSFYTNRPSDIPCQTNDYDCAIFACMYARSLLKQGPMVAPKGNSILDIRCHMLLELHSNSLLPVPPKAMQIDDYYAVHYVKHFYIGRVLEVKSDGFVTFKFLHSTIGNTFDWPRRDDIDTVHASCVFFGPVQLLGHGPFNIVEYDIVKKVFFT